MIVIIIIIYSDTLVFMGTPAFMVLLLPSFRLRVMTFMGYLFKRKKLLVVKQNQLEHILAKTSSKGK